MLGRKHPLLRRVRELRRDPLLRCSEGVFLAEGFHLAQAALLSQAPVELFLVSPRLEDRDEGRRVFSAIRSSGIPFETTADAVLDGLQDARSPQPVLALVHRTERSLSETLRGGGPWVAAWGIQDPGNLGALWRTSDAAGAGGLFVVGDSVDPYHPRAVRATTGSVFRVPVVETPLAPLLEGLRARGASALGAAADARDAHHAADLRSPFALFVGREASGLAPEVARQLDRTLRIPMRSGVQSLSVNAAAAVILFEAGRQRETAG